LSRIHPYCSIYSRSSIGTPSSDGQTCQLVKTKLYLLVATLFLAFGWAPSLLAQVTSGTILGSLQDTTGAVVSGARVTATDRSIGSTRTVTSGTNGTFSLPNLPVGTYHLTISANGFETVEKSGLVLSSADHLNAGVITLNVGTEATTVTVTADTGQLQLQANSGERSDLITGKQMNDIALNGRNVLDILRVIPGVSGVGSFGASGTGGLDTYSVNGTRTNQHDFVMDGTSNVDSGNNGGTQVTENTDAIAEVKVLTSNFQAEFGKAGGGSVVVTSRGGSNDFHGNLHFFHRNDGMNANDWVSNHNDTAKQLYRYNTFGYQIGGPIKKDKLYFFFSNEFYRQLVPGSISQYRTPTALERAGDFSQTVDSSGNPIQIFNPVTGQQFAGNKIDSSALTAAEQASFTEIQKILSLYPLPNVTGNNSYNRQDPLSSSHPRTEYIGRVDYQISPSQRLFARYINNRDVQTGPVGSFGLECSGSLQIPGGCTNKQPGWNLAVDLTSTLSPNIVNEVSFGTSVYSSLTEGVNGNLSVGANNINLPLLFAVTSSTSIPDFSFSGNGQNYPSTYFGATPWHQAATNISVNDNLTWSLHSHLLKFGVFYERSRKDQIAWGNSNGQFSFSNCSSSSAGCVSGASSSTDGSPIASALLGYFQNFDQSSSRPTGYFRYNQLEFYAQDTWQISPRLTLDYGIRFVYIPPQYDAKNQIALFTPSAYNPANAVQVDANGNVIPGTGDALNGMTYSANGTLPKGGWNSTGIIPEPRIGFAYDLFGDHKGVLRGGFGTSHDREQGNLVFNTVFGNPALVQTPTIYNNTLSNISPTAEAANTGVLSGIYGADVSGQVPATYSYSLGIQREIAGGVTLDVSYVGNVGRHLVTARDLNTIPYGTAFTRAAQNPANFAGGVVPDVEPNLPPEYAAAGYSFSGQYAYAQNYLSPYKGYGQMEYYKFDGTSNYNSLQVSAQRRFNRSLTFGGFYTWSKTLTTSTADESFVDPFNPRKYNYGVAGFDRKSVAAINYIYSLPNFTQKLNGPHWLSYATDGYQLSGLASMQSGEPVNTALWVPANQFNGGSQWSKVAPAYVNVDALGNLVVPTIGQPMPSASGSLRQGGMVTWDSSIFKNFNIGPESTGRYLQVRGEFFNILNHPNIASRDYGANLTLPSYNGNGTFTPMSISKDSNWGQPTSSFNPAGPGGPRVIQLAAKLYF
jgi:Carboxypeptidase regulatory-like domain/TonB-dependent Receptor Plug Domain